MSIPNMEFFAEKNIRFIVLLEKSLKFIELLKVRCTSSYNINVTYCNGGAGRAFQSKNNKKVVTKVKTLLF